MHGAKPAKVGFGAPPLPRERKHPMPDPVPYVRPSRTEDADTFEPPAEGATRPRVVVENCPTCKGRGRVRDRSLLPWNNWPASGSLIVGFAGLCGSACLNENHRALLIVGLLFSGLGILLYAVGDTCPKCKGRKEERRIIKPRPKPKPSHPEFAGLSDDRAFSQPPPAELTEDSPQHAARPKRPPAARQDTNLRRQRPQVF